MPVSSGQYFLAKGSGNTDILLRPKALTASNRNATLCGHVVQQKRRKESSGPNPILSTALLAQEKTAGNGIKGGVCVFLSQAQVCL